MMTREKMLYSKTAASTIVRTLPHLVKRVEEFANCVLVVAKGLRPKFVSKKQFYAEFIESRKQRAIELDCEPLTETEYIVTNPHNSNRYLVELTKQGIECGCDDYQNEHKTLGRGVCKHGYRTLFEIGCTSLKEYIAMGKV